MTDAGIDENEADEIVSELMWAVFEAPIRVGYALTRALGANPRRRLRLANWLSWKLVFRSPFAHVSRSRPGDVTYDITACPFAAYAAAAGRADFTRVAACSLDNRLATTWQSGFERHATIAEGADHCDFTFTVRETSISIDQSRNTKAQQERTS